MSYRLSTGNRRRRPVAMGATALEIAAKAKAAAQKAKEIASPLTSIIGSALSDPALVPVINRIQTIRSLSSSSSSSPGASVGLGLGGLVKPLDAYIAIQRKPYLLPLGAVAVVGVPLLVGYLLGRSR